jgi:hypothetical protein
MAGAWRDSDESSQGSAEKSSGSSKRPGLPTLALLVRFGIICVACPSASHAAEQGLLMSDFMRLAGIVLIVVDIVGLIFFEFFYNHVFHKATYHMLLLVGLFAIPGIALMSTSAFVLDETEKVDACNSCHVMEPFVSDLRNPDSPTLAARHYKNRWIADHQCYSCHTTYGAHGTLSGKRDGFRHWLLYVTHTWKEPIKYSGSFENSVCLDCHVGTRKFGGVKSHQALLSELGANRVRCTTCHGPPHPVPSERATVVAEARR